MNTYGYLQERKVDNMPNKYLNEEAIEIIEANQRPGQTASGVIMELAKEAGAKIPKEAEVEA